MRIAVLTTDTLHHRYFLWRLTQEIPEGAEVVLNVFEEKPYPWGRRARRHLLQSLPNLWRSVALNPYLRSASLLRRQAAYERGHFFPNKIANVPDAFPTSRIFSANDKETEAMLDRASPDVLLVYGTGKLYSHVFERIPLGAVNAHGGLLPGYRGLDTNLWAALEGRPQDMAVTLHRIDAELDTGPIYQTRRIGKVPSLNLINLRYHTAVLCTDIFLEVIRYLVAGTATTKLQRGDSQYFGPMPVLLQRRAERIIKAYVAEAGQPVAAAA